MQLNEVIEENSIATISKRTRISIENIEKLVQRDFSDMKRVKALGFISILEREFGIELEALKKECAAYFSGAPEEEFDARLVVTVPDASERMGGFTSKLLMLLILFGIGYGTWYFLAAKDSSSDNNTTIGSSTFVGTIVSQAKAWLGNSSSLETDEPTVTTDGVWAKTEKNETTETASEEPVSEKSTGKEKNDSTAEEQIIREVKQEQQEILSQATEPNDASIADAEKTDNMADSTPNVGNTAVSEVPAVAPATDTLATEVPSMAQEKTEEAATAMEEVLPPQIKTRSAKKPAKKTKKQSGKIQIVTLHPMKKVWVGYTDLGTMKRAAKVIEGDIDFDTSSTSWILVAGHNAINFVIKGKATTPKKRDKNYFLIKNGKVKDISKEEFQKLNKSTVW